MIFMRSIRYFSIFIFLLQFPIFSQFEVKIEVKTPSVADSEAVFVVGNSPQLGNWNPSAVKMTKISSGKWQYVFNLLKSETIEFKFTKGSWNLEAVNSNGSVPGNIIVNVNKDTLLSFDICCWNKNQTTNFKGQITGEVEYFRGVGEGNILPRDIIVLLPDGYKDSDEKYPVLYMHDGQNIFDPSTCGFGVDWQVDEALDSLTKQGKVQKMIVVGIYNSINRRSEYSHSDLGREYMKFIVTNVKPMIDKKYRTKPERDFTYTAGSSMGGLISFMFLWEYNDVFSKAGCFSPVFKIDKFDYVSIVKKTSESKRSFTAYIDNGGVALDARLQPGVEEMVYTLDKLGYKENVDLIVNIDPKADHNETAWAKRVPTFLLDLFGTQKK
jgi:predicted alpha/beta superfamily hydrolase